MRRRKILQRCSIQSSSLHCNDQSSLEGWFEFIAWGPAPLRKNKQMEINRSDSDSITSAEEEADVREVHRIRGWLPTGVRRGTGKRRIPYSCSAQRHKSGDKLHNFLLSYLQAIVTLCLPNQGPQDRHMYHKRWQLRRATTYFHRPFMDLKSFHKICLLQIVVYRAPSSCSAED